MRITVCRVRIPALTSVLHNYTGQFFITVKNGPSFSGPASSAPPSECTVRPVVYNRLNGA